MKEEPLNLDNKVVTPPLSRLVGAPFPVVEVGRVYEYGADEYIPESREVVEKISREHFGNIRNKYVMVKQIAGINYFFRLSGVSQSKAHSQPSLAFKTLEYEYARTDLNLEQTQELMMAIAQFLESCYLDNSYIGPIMIEPANASYTSKEIQECRDIILANDNNLKEEDLVRDFTGVRIFELYKEIFKSNFIPKDKDKYDYHQFKSKARSRYFKTNFKKYLTSWDIVEDPYGSSRFYIVRAGSQ